MQFSERWLRTLVDPPLSTAELTHLLTMSGLEVESCEPFLLRQLELIRPEVVVALGKFAAQTLLRTKAPISQLRGRWFDFRGMKLLPTFHPAYLLRNPGDKRLVWEDVRKVMGVLGLPVARA